MYEELKESAQNLTWAAGQIAEHQDTIRQTCYTFLEIINETHTHLHSVIDLLVTRFDQSSPDVIKLIETIGRAYDTLPVRDDQLTVYGPADAALAKLRSIAEDVGVAAAAFTTGLQSIAEANEDPLSALGHEQRADIIAVVKWAADTTRMLRGGGFEVLHDIFYRAERLDKEL